MIGNSCTERHSYFWNSNALIDMNRNGHHAEFVCKMDGGTRFIDISTDTSVWKNFLKILCNKWNFHQKTFFRQKNLSLRKKMLKRRCLAEIQFSVNIFRHERSLKVSRIVYSNSLYNMVSSHPVFMRQTICNIFVNSIDMTIVVVFLLIRTSQHCSTQDISMSVSFNDCK